MRHGITTLAVCALFAVACGGDSAASNNSGGGDGQQACYDVCQAQDAAEMAGNCPGLGLSTCKLLCDALVGSACEAEYKAHNECMLTGNFDCGLISAQSDADCSAELDALNTCENGATGMCTGANDAGVCPAVACQCPGGEQSISGTTSQGGQCSCLDETTCQDLCF